MDIAGISMAMANADISSRVGVAMLDKTMDVNEQLGQGLVQMIDAAAMEQSVTPHLGANFDMRV